MVYHKRYKISLFNIWYHYRIYIITYDIQYICYYMTYDIRYNDMIWDISMRNTYMDIWHICDLLSVMLYRWCLQLWQLVGHQGSFMSRYVRTETAWSLIHSGGVVTVHHKLVVLDLFNMKFMRFPEIFHGFPNSANIQVQVSDCPSFLGPVSSWHSCECQEQVPNAEMCGTRQRISQNETVLQQQTSTWIRLKTDDPKEASCHDKYKMRFFDQTQLIFDASRRSPIYRQNPPISSFSVSNGGEWGLRGAIELASTRRDLSANLAGMKQTTKRKSQSVVGVLVLFGEFIKKNHKTKN